MIAGGKSAWRLRLWPGVGAQRLEDLRAWQLARAFKLEVYRLIRHSPKAAADLRFKSQLQDAASSGEANTAEGFRRYVAPEFAQFLRYSAASIEEAVCRVQDGIDREYFDVSECQTAFNLGLQAGKTTTALQTSLRQMARSRRERRPRDQARTKDRAPGTD
jgi:four helix bundle protein